MAAAVKIKDGKYGSAIGLLLRRGGSFQTCHERTLIVTEEQRKALEDADFIETNGNPLQAGQGRGQKEKSRRSIQRKP